jgi:hypothetical protein
MQRDVNASDSTRTSASAMALSCYNAARWKSRRREGDAAGGRGRTPRFPAMRLAIIIASRNAWVKSSRDGIPLILLSKPALVSGYGPRHTSISPDLHLCR